MFLTSKAMKRYFAEYEQWMLRKPEGGTSFRECVRNEVESFCAALRTGTAFEPWRFRDGGKPDAGTATEGSGTEKTDDTPADGPADKRPEDERPEDKRPEDERPEDEEGA